MNNLMRISCSHCGELNEAGTPFCKECGHCADRPRMACICRQCRRPDGRGVDEAGNCSRQGNRG